MHALRRQSRHTYDAIVVGSGISGGWAAKELCQKGLETLVLERGRMVEHSRDYVTEHKQPWEFTYRGLGDRQTLEREHPVQRLTYACREDTMHFFINDRENPYVQEHPFTWIRGNHVGGRSLTWGRQCYRWSDIDFEANARDGHGVDWPLRYDDLAPWYTYVERFAGISGEALGLPQLPDGEFLPPMPLNAAERIARERIEAAFPERNLTIGRVAVLTRDHNGRAACHYCGPCERGCSTGSYFSTQSATLPAARATGNLTLRPHSLVHSVLYDEDQDRAVGVRVIDAETREEMEFYARVIFLCASTLGTTQIMLNSTSPRFPDGIANSSGALGHYLMDHHFQVGATAVAAGIEDRYYQGNRPNGVYVPRFRNIGPGTEHPDFVRGYGFQGSATRLSWQRGTELPGFGSEFKELLRDPAPWTWWLGAWGEMLPRYENRVELTDETDAWGLPVLRISCTWGDNERAMRADMAATAAEMLEAAGTEQVTPFDDLEQSPPGFCIHEMGTARMGRDPRTSVLNGYNQCHDVPNLFVTDGACMASSACQNPSITYMALTARAVDFAVNEMKRYSL